MKVSLQNSKFFLTQNQFSRIHRIIKTDPEKIDTIIIYPLPKNIRELRSFLGL